MSRADNENAVLAVKEAADILEVVGEVVTLKKAGANYLGLCPFHGEKTPSFTVNAARGFFHCFGCGVGGDALAFVMRYQNLGFWDAVKQLAGKYHISLPEKDLSPREREFASKRKLISEINERAAAIYHHQLLTDPGAESARRYLKKRKIPAEVVESFQLGYAPESWDFLLKKMDDAGPEALAEAGLVVAKESGGGFYDRFRNRVLFPILGPSGQYLGFGGRTLGDDKQAKYLNSPETLVFNKGRTLFGLYQNKEAIRRSKRALIVEGNFDLISLVAAGIHDVVAPLGTALTLQHIHSLKGYAQEAVLLFDGDQAGIKAAMRAVPLFLTEKVDAKVVILPDGHDPDTFVNAHGAEALERTLDEASSLPEFVVNHLVATHGLTLAGKGRIIEDLKPIIKAISDQDLQRSLFISHFSQKLGLSPEQLQNVLTGPVTIHDPGPEVKKATTSVLSPVAFSKAEEQLLSFLIIYPEYAESFIEAGLFEALIHPAAINIAKSLAETHQNYPGSGAERLLDILEGAERAFVSRQLIEVPFLPDTELEAEEKIHWLRANRRKYRMRELTALINDAQQHDDQDLMLKLLIEKNQIGES